MAFAVEEKVDSLNILLFSVIKELWFYNAESIQNGPSSLCWWLGLNNHSNMACG